MKQSLIIYDHLNTPDILAAYDDIVPYTYFPDERLSYAFDLNELVTGVDNIIAKTDEYTLSVKNKQLTVSQLSKKTSSVSVYTLDGTRVLEKEFSDREIQIEVSQYKQQILIVRIENERSVLNKKILVH